MGHRVHHQIEALACRRAPRARAGDREDSNKDRRAEETTRRRRTPRFWRADADREIIEDLRKHKNLGQPRFGEIHWNSTNLGFGLQCTKP